MNKLEECARAIYEQQLGDKLPWEMIDHKKYLRQTRAVIRCLMEPSERMSRTLATALMDGAGSDAAYRAMLQYVLDEAGEK